MKKILKISPSFPYLSLSKSSSTFQNPFISTLSHRAIVFNFHFRHVLEAFFPLPPSEVEKKVTSGLHGSLPHPPRWLLPRYFSRKEVWKGGGNERANEEFVVTGSEKGVVEGDKGWSGGGKRGKRREERDDRLLMEYPCKTWKGGGDKVTWARELEILIPSEKLQIQGFRSTSPSSGG